MSVAVLGHISYCVCPFWSRCWHQIQPCSFQTSFYHFSFCCSHSIAQNNLQFSHKYIRHPNLVAGSRKMHEMTSQSIYSMHYLLCLRNLPHLVVAMCMICMNHQLILKNWKTGAPACNAPDRCHASRSEVKNGPSSSRYSQCQHVFQSTLASIPLVTYLHHDQNCRSDTSVGHPASESSRKVWWVHLVESKEDEYTELWPTSQLQIYFKMSSGCLHTCQDSGLIEAGKLLLISSLTFRSHVDVCPNPQFLEFPLQVYSFLYGFLQKGHYFLSQRIMVRIYYVPEAKILNLRITLSIAGYLFWLLLVLMWSLKLLSEEQSTCMCAGSSHVSLEESVDSSWISIKTTQSADTCQDQVPQLPHYIILGLQCPISYCRDRIIH